jgi:ribonuclease HI
MADRGGGMQKSSDGASSKSKNNTKKKYYAVASGRKPGVYETWDECKKQVFSFPNAQHKVKNNTFPPSFPPFARANAPLFDKRISRI